jgi:hypothetical protein
MITPIHRFLFCCLLGGAVMWWDVAPAVTGLIGDTITTYFLFEGRYPGEKSEGSYSDDIVFKVIAKDTPASDQDDSYTDETAYRAMAEVVINSQHPWTGENVWWETLLSYFKGHSVVQTWTWESIKHLWGAIRGAIAFNLRRLVAFGQWMLDLFRSYEQRALEANEVYMDLDQEVSALVQEYKAMASMCHNPADQATRAECGKAMRQSSAELREILRERRKARRLYEKYEILSRQP